MAIVASDIKYRLSVVTASAGDTQAGTPATSLGDQVATTVITAASLNNLFDDVSGAEAAAGDVEYRCFFVLNDHASLTLTTATAILTSQTAGGGTIDFGLDPAGITAKGAAGAQAATIANESAAPAGVTFNTTNQLIGNLAPGQVQGIWLRRTVTAGAGAVNPDGVIMTVQGDTLP
jgi:hypothetical protein